MDSTVPELHAITALCCALSGGLAAERQGQTQRAGVETLRRSMEGTPPGCREIRPRQEDPLVSEDAATGYSALPIRSSAVSGVRSQLDQVVVRITEVN